MPLSQRQPAVLFVSSEATPLVKVGGLADVVGSLPQALRHYSCDARIILPRYKSLNAHKLRAKILVTTTVRFGNALYPVTIFKTTLPKTRVPVYLVEQDYWLSSGSPYQAPGEISDHDYLVKRSLFFCAAVARCLPQLAWRPDILHIHDWMTAPLAIILKKILPTSSQQTPKTLLTIHNLDHQQYASDDALQQAGLDPQMMQVAITNAKGERYTNLLGEGIACADAVNTVSPQYAKEIKRPEFGHGLEKIIKRRKNSVSGILNGIDTKLFNPKTDRALATRYDLEHHDKKLFNKKSLRQRLGLPVDETALLCGVVSRLAPQKGVDLITEAIKRLHNHNFQFVILGQGQSDVIASLAATARQYPASLAFVPRFDATLAQLIYAGSDVFLMPSKFEPCGLGQMIAMRYGTLPVVRDTGGLHDTVQDFRKLGGQGFVFKQFSADALVKTLLVALKIFADKKRWQQLQRTAMQEDFSWGKSAKKYMRLYNNTILNKN